MPYHKTFIKNKLNSVQSGYTLSHHKMQNKLLYFKISHEDILLLPIFSFSTKNTQ